jgi:hypothetical protein
LSFEQSGDYLLFRRAFALFSTGFILNIVKLHSINFYVYLFVSCLHCTLSTFALETLEAIEPFTAQVLIKVHLCLDLYYFYCILNLKLLFNFLIIIYCDVLIQLYLSLLPAKGRSRFYTNCRVTPPEKGGFIVASFSFSLFASFLFLSLCMCLF